MTIDARRLLVLATWMAAVASGACGGTAAHDGAAGTGGSDACDHDGCVVPLSAATGVCPSTFSVMPVSCPGVLVQYARCGSLDHVEIATVGPRHDCYYDGASHALVGAIIRSDAGFTKRAGTIPTEECPAVNTFLCGTPAGAAGTGGMGGQAGSSGDPTTGPCEFVTWTSPNPDGGAPTFACPTAYPSGRAPPNGCAGGAVCEYPQGSCTCGYCKYGGELYLSRCCCS